VTKSRALGGQHGEKTLHRAPGSPREGKHPDCRDGVPLRGGRRNGDLGWCSMREGIHPLENMRHRRPRGARRVKEEGSHLSPIAGTAYEREGRPFHSWLAGPCTHIAIVSTILGATDGGYRKVASHAAGRRTVVFGASLEDGLAPGFRKVSKVRSGSLPAPSPNEKGLSHASSAEQAGEGSGGRPNGAGGNASTPERKSEDWTLEVVLARRFCRSRSRQLVVWRREAGALHSKRVGSVRGRASSVRPHRAKARTVGRERAPVLDRSGNLT
jgi:hypothetical protein